MMEPPRDPNPAPKQGQGARFLLAGGVATALAGAAWALVQGETCGTCSHAGRLVGGINLAALGVVYYVALLAAAWRAWKSPLVTGGILVAGGVHLSLAGMLLAHRIFCPPCFLAAAGALWACLVLVWLGDSATLWRAAALVPVVALLTNVGAGTLRRQAEKRDRREAARAAEKVLAERHSAANGRVRMVVYVRRDCSYCERFKSEAIPALRQEFGGRLEIEERPAWKGLPTPTIIVLGKESTLFPGLPDELAELHEAVRLAGALPGGRRPQHGMPLIRPGRSGQPGYFRRFASGSSTRKPTSRPRYSGS